MQNTLRKHLTIILLFSCIIITTGLYSADTEYSHIDLSKISRYNEDRIAFQHIEKERKQYTHNRIDNSRASLLVIKDSKMYYFVDGYDDANVVETRRVIFEMQNKLLPDLWQNKIDNQPDLVVVTDRRIEILRKKADQQVDKEGHQTKNENLSGSYVTFYQDIRDKLIKKHIQIFKTLMINRKESGLYVKKEPIPKKLSYEGPTKYYTSVTGKTIDGKIYFAEDADGDGVTETFTVTLPDGFHWGYNSGPNIIFIYNNSKEEIKKQIEKLAHMAYYGTPEEEKIIDKSFIQKEEVEEMIDDLYRMNDDDRKLLNP